MTNDRWALQLPTGFVPSDSITFTRRESIARCVPAHLRAIRTTTEVYREWRRLRRAGWRTVRIRLEVIK